MARILRIFAVESNGLGHKVSNGGHIGQPLRRPAQLNLIKYMAKEKVHDKMYTTEKRKVRKCNHQKA